jgi:hypothetical protein
VAGLLVLLVTVLVVNQLLNRRQAGQRGHAVAAQAAILVAQAARSAMRQAAACPRWSTGRRRPRPRPRAGPRVRPRPWPYCGHAA